MTAAPNANLAPLIAKIDALHRLVDKMSDEVHQLSAKVTCLPVINQIACMAGAEALFSQKDLLEEFRKEMVANGKYLEGRIAGQTQKINALLKHNGLPVFNQMGVGSPLRVPEDELPTPVVSEDESIFSPTIRKRKPIDLRRSCRSIKVPCSYADLPSDGESSSSCSSSEDDSMSDSMDAFIPDVDHTKLKNAFVPNRFKKTKKINI